jgi:predicted  nucleic acid-binding Zn-ribbon protein
MKGIEELKTAIQNVTVRYTEIGDLKKNDLVLRNMLESLQLSIESSKKAATNGLQGKVVELEKEVLALKAEVRKTYERMESLESSPEPAAQDAIPMPEFLSLREQVAACGKLQVVQEQQVQAELSSLREQLQQASSQLKALQEKLENRPRPVPPAVHSAHGEMRSIRESLDEIRGFMDTLTRKLIQ